MNQLNLVPQGHFCKVETDTENYLVQFYCDWKMNRLVLNVFTLDPEGEISGIRYQSSADDDFDGFTMGYARLILEGLGIQLPHIMILRIDYDRTRQASSGPVIYSTHEEGVNTPAWARLINEIKDAQHVA